MSFKENIYIPAIAELTLYFNGIYYMMTAFFSSRIVSVSILLVVFLKKTNIIWVIAHSYVYSCLMCLRMS